MIPSGISNREETMCESQSEHLADRNPVQNCQTKPSSPLRINSHTEFYKLVGFIHSFFKKAYREYVVTVSQK